MIKKRIIPCLDIDRGMVVKGVNFKDIKEVSEPSDLAKFYNDIGADELCLLDITATSDGRNALYKTIESVAMRCSIPFSVGGGIKNLDDAERIIGSGADKVSVGSSAVYNPKLIYDIAKKFGSQCVIASLDVSKEDGIYWLYVKGGREKTGVKVFDHIKILEENGVGELLINSINKDGTKDGYDIFLNSEISKMTNVPIIASGGAGKMEHFLDVIKNGHVDAVLAASVFHFGEIKISDLKNYLIENGVDVRMVSF
jgi:cyclase